MADESKNITGFVDISKYEPPTVLEYIPEEMRIKFPTLPTTISMNPEIICRISTDHTKSEYCL